MMCIILRVIIFSVSDIELIPQNSNNVLARTVARKSNHFFGYSIKKQETLLKATITTTRQKRSTHNIVGPISIAHVTIV